MSEIAENYFNYSGVFGVKHYDIDAAETKLPPNKLFLWLSRRHKRVVKELKSLLALLQISILNYEGEDESLSRGERSALVMAKDIARLVFAETEADKKGVWLKTNEEIVLVRQHFLYFVLESLDACVPPPEEIQEVEDPVSAVEGCSTKCGTGISSAVVASQPFDLGGCSSTPKYQLDEADIDILSLSPPISITPFDLDDWLTDLQIECLSGVQYCTQEI
jgi:hypothetical protein